MPNRKSHYKIRNNKNANKSTFPSRKVALSKQLYESDVYVCDFFVNLADNANTGYDLYTQIVQGQDYTNNQATYGEMCWLAAEFDYMPFFRGSALSTDYAVGAFGTRQGLYDVTVTAKTMLNVLREPGSILVSNKEPFYMKIPIAQGKYTSTGNTNTIQSEVPKVNFYVGWGTVASTNTGAGVLRLSVLIKYRSKID